MDRSNFFQDQDVMCTDLNNIESTKIIQIQERTQASLGNSGGIGGGLQHYSSSVAQGGIYGSPADYSTSSKNFYSLQVESTMLMVAPGEALTSLGELISSTSYITAVMGSPTSTTNWVVSANVQNYVKLQYQETSGSIKSDDQGNPYPTRYTGSPFIQVDGNIPLSTDILLSTFLAASDGSITSNSLSDSRTYIRTITPANAVILDPLIKVVSAFNTAEDHINAIGTGSPSIHNPHGMTVADMGYIDQIGVHRIEAHDAAIIDTTGAYLPGTFFTAFQPTIIGIPFPYISFQAPSVTPTAAIEVGGHIYNAAIPPAMLASGTTTGPIIFPAYWTGSEWATYNGEYYVYLNSVGALQAASSSVMSIPYNTPDRFVLCSLNIKTGGSSYDSFTDLRSFYSITQEKIRADFVEGTEVGSTSLDPVGNNNYTIIDNLNRIRYQLGMAINGTSSGWNTAAPVLTAGSGSIADSLHTHMHDQLSDIRTTTAIKSNLLTLTAGSGSNADSLHTHSSLAALAVVPQFKTISVFPILSFSTVGGTYTSPWKTNGNPTTMFITLKITVSPPGIISGLGISVIWSYGGSPAYPSPTEIAATNQLDPSAGIIVPVLNLSFMIPSGHSWKFVCTATNPDVTASGYYTACY